jgi:hypothetical protein
MTVPGVRFGAPGVYQTERRPPPAFSPVRLDVAGFVGAAPRGPVDTPVAIDGWTDYRWRFGGYEGPGLLPYAVHAFFAQGGERAYVLRVSPLPRLPDQGAWQARAAHRVTLGSPAGAPVEVDLVARDEGRWGDGLAVRWDFDVAAGFDASVNGAELTLPEGAAVPPGALLRLRGDGLPVAGAFHWVLRHAVRDDGRGGRRRVALVEPAPLPSRGDRPAEVGVDVVAATLTITDADRRLAREERLANLGLRRGHPRFAGDVLAEVSRLVVPAATWPDELYPPDLFLTSARSRLVRAGTDRWPGIGAGSFFGDTEPGLLPTGGYQDNEDGPAVYGVDRMSLVPDIGTLAVPDLLWSGTVAKPRPEPPGSPRPPVFAPCVPAPDPVTYPPPALVVAQLDAGTELPEIVRRQRRVVALAERQRRFVALLDVPGGLPPRGIARWRAQFDTSYGAASHPWLGVVPSDGSSRDVTYVPPSAFTAGIIADRERRLGIPWGPANELALDAVKAAVAMSDADQDELHLLGVNVFRAERDGFRLASARTLSSTREYRQLSVRRLMTMLRLALARQAQWVTFEPHTGQLRGALRDALTQLLRGLFRGGAFAGATEEESFFVRCDENLNPPWSQGLGRLVAEVGVAPAEPLEYLVLRISQDADGSIAIEG